MTTADFPHAKDKVVILKRLPFFARCTDRQLLLIAERTRLLEYKKGEVIYRQGSPADAFYIVVSGRLRVVVRDADFEKTVAFLHNDDVFGEISLLTGENHSADIHAINDTLVLQLQKADFDEVINRVPPLVLHLSRILSKRLRTKELTGEFGEATIAAIYSAIPGVGCTVFAVALAATLVRETGRRTVLVDLSGTEGSRKWLYPAGRAPTRHAPARLNVHAQLANARTDHPMGFPVVCASELVTEADGEQAIAPLLSTLAKEFSFVLIDLPVQVSAPVLKALTQADVTYCVTDAERAHIIKTKALIQQVRTAVTTIEPTIKVVLNQVPPDPERMSFFHLLFTPPERIDHAAIANQLGQPIDFTVPRLQVPRDGLTLDQIQEIFKDHRAPFTLALRRIGRELGGQIIGLALGSGAALGLAHVGVLKVLERERIPIDIIAGSSIGSLIGGLWASGKSAAELEELALRFKNPWDVRRLFLLDLGIPAISLVIGAAVGFAMGLMTGVLAGFLVGLMVTLGVGLVLGPLAGGPIQGRALMAKLEEDFGGATFESTRIPLKIVAADPMTREEVIFDSGSIAAAVRASVSIPGIFKPVMHRGKMCLDGGVVNPVPVSILKQAGARHVIAINVFPTSEELRAHVQAQKLKREEWEVQIASRSFPIRLMAWLGQELHRAVTPIIFEVIMRSLQSMEFQIAEVACAEADLTLRPTVADAHWLEFFSAEKFIRRGEEVAMEHLPELKRLTQPPEQVVDKS